MTQPPDITPMREIAVPRPAATVVLLRDGANGVETLLMRRNARASFMPEAYVFPGGALDAADAAPELAARCVAASDHDVSNRLGVASGGLAWLLAGIRECFEESGILLADGHGQGHDRGGRVATLGDENARLSWRRELLAQQRTFADFCAHFDLRPGWQQLAYHSRWVTPPVKSKRFDTRFFVARSPRDQAASLASEELADLLWISPAEALQRARDNTLLLMRATRETLGSLRAFADVDAALRHVRALPSIPEFLPTIPAST